jgi:hypothetical protein
MSFPRITFDSGDTNDHDHAKAIAANWNTDVALETVHGPKIDHIPMEHMTRKGYVFYWRWICYAPSGAWLGINFYMKGNTQ